MPDFEWGTDDRYRSNNGAGDYRARILCVVDGVAHMERWRGSKGPEGKRLERFYLNVDFLKSGRCGWKRQP